MLIICLRSILEHVQKWDKTVLHCCTQLCRVQYRIAMLYGLHDFILFDIFE